MDISLLCAKIEALLPNHNLAFWTCPNVDDGFRIGIGEEEPIIGVSYDPVLGISFAHCDERGRAIDGNEIYGVHPKVVHKRIAELIVRVLSKQSLT